MLDLLYDVPVIAAVKDDEGLELALNSNAPFVFSLYGTIVSIGAIVEKIKAVNKLAFVHVDLVDGLAPRESAIDYIASSTKADGIITTKQNLIKYAKEKNLFTVQRVFLLDSKAVVNIRRLINSGEADMFEILPGVIHKVTKMISSMSDKPIITGGLILDKEDVINALGAGATAVSTSVPSIWSM